MSEILQYSRHLNDLKSEIRKREVQLARSDQTQKRLAWSLELYENERTTKRQSGVVPVHSDRPCRFMNGYSLNQRDEFLVQSSAEVKMAFKSDLSPVMDDRASFGHRRPVLEPDSIIFCSAPVSPSLAAGQLFTKQRALDSEKTFDDITMFSSQEFESFLGQLEKTVLRLDGDVNSIQDSLRLNLAQTNSNLALYPIVLDLTSKCQALRRTLKARNASKIKRSSEEPLSQSSPVKNPPSTLKLLRTIDAALRVTSSSPPGKRFISPKKHCQRHAIFGEDERSTMHYRRSTSQHLHTSHRGRTSDPSHVKGAEAEYRALHTPQDRWETAHDSDEQPSRAFQWGSDPGPTRARAAAGHPSASTRHNPLLQKRRVLREPQAAPTVDAAGVGALAHGVPGFLDSTPMPALKPCTLLAEVSVPASAQHWDQAAHAKPDGAARPVAGANASPPVGEEPAQQEGKGLSPPRIWSPAPTAASPATAFCDDLRGPSQREPGGKDGSSTGPWGCSGVGRAVASRVAEDPLILCCGMMGSPAQTVAGSPRPSVEAGPDLGRQSCPQPGARPRRVAVEGRRRTLRAPPGLPGIGGLNLAWGRRDRPEFVGGSSPGCCPNGSTRSAAAAKYQCAGSPCSSESFSHARSILCCDGGYSGGSDSVWPSIPPLLAGDGRLGLRCPAVLTAGPTSRKSRAVTARLARPGWSMLRAASHSRSVGLRVLGCGEVKALGLPVVARSDARGSYRRKRADPMLPKGRVGAGAQADAHARLKLWGLLLAAVGDRRVQSGKQKPFECLHSSAGHLCSPLQPQKCKRPWTVRTATWRGGEQDITEWLQRWGAELLQGRGAGGLGQTRRSVEVRPAGMGKLASRRGLGRCVGRLAGPLKLPSLRVSRRRNGCTLSAKWGMIRRAWSYSAVAERQADDSDGARYLACSRPDLSTDSTASTNKLESNLRAGNEGLDLQRCVGPNSVPHVLQAGPPRLSCDARTGVSSEHAAVNVLKQDGLQDHLDGQVLVGAGDGSDGEFAAVTMSQVQPVSLPGIVGAAVQGNEMALLRAEIIRGSAERAVLFAMVQQRDVELEAARAHILSLAAEVTAKESEVLNAAAALVAAKEQVLVYQARGEWQSWTEHVDQWFG